MQGKGGVDGASEAQRVVEVQQHMQAVCMALLAPVKFGGQSFVLRELQPQQDRLMLGAVNKPNGSLKVSVATISQMLV